ncbi:MAG: PEGA domain-containing protein [Polyangiaceae bacterium]|nr:PEGA domain-containing protein [Polyangiaceae bacterium]
MASSAADTLSRRRRPACPSLWAACLVVLGAGPLALPREARAQPAAEPTPEDKETARELMDQGHAHFKANDFAGALKAYLAADRIMGVPTTALGVARAQERLGHLLEAHDALLRAQMFPVHPNEPLAFGRARERAAELDKDVAARIPSLQVKVAPPDAKAELRVDGQLVPEAALDLPRKLDPGEHEVRVGAVGFATVETKVSLKEGEQRSLDIGLVRGTAPDAPAGDGVLRPLWPLVLAGAGVAGAGLLIGTITGGVSLARARALAADCPDDVCAPDRQPDIDRTIALANGANASFVFAGLGAAAAVVGLFVGPAADTPDETARQAHGLELRLELGAGALGLCGAF